MAGTKVRGITIEIGGDTTGLSKALTNINKEIGSTQRQLKDVEKLLKLDPTNTELLEQKQRLLGDRIGETETKLKALKEAQKQAGEELKRTGEGQEAYDALTREIISCEEELKSLQRQAIESNTALQNISVAGQKLQEVGGKVSQLGDNLTRNVTVPIVGAGTAVVKMAGDFEQQMAKVSGIAQAYGDDLESLKQNAMDLAESSRFGATEIAQAYEYMGMAGWKTNQILEGTPGIIDLATASGEDLATVSDIVTDGLTAFGLKAEDTGRFVNVLAEAARSSNTNVGLMGESFKYAAPVAGSLGYSIEDVATALGLMANSGIKASMAGTSLRNIFQRMVEEPNKAAMAMDRLGVSLQNDEGEMYSFREIMDQLRTSMADINISAEDYDKAIDNLDKRLEDGTITQKKYESELEELNKQLLGAEGAEKARAASMLGGTRAMSALLAVANATEEDYNNLTEAINNSGQAMAMLADGSVVPLNEALASGQEIIAQYEGTAAAMAGTMNDTTQGAMAQLMNQIQNMAIELGKTLLPMVKEVVQIITEWAKKFRELSPETQEMIVKIALVVAALGPLLAIGGRLVSGVGMLMTSIPKIAAALGTTLGPIAAVAAAIGLLVAAFIHLWNTNEEFRNGVTQTWNELKAAFDGFTQGIVDRLNELGFDFENFGDVVKTVWDNICKALGPQLKAALDMVASILKGALQVLTGIFDVFAGLFTGNWKQMWNGVKEIFTGIWEAIKGVLKAALNGMFGLVNNMIDGINKISVAGHSPNIPKIPMLANGGVLTSGSAIVGEAGAELLTVSNGQAMVEPLGGQTSELTQLLSTYLPYLAMNQQIVLDSGALVGGTSRQMNEALGQLSIREAYT